jgi:hypothetical protein
MTLLQRGLLRGTAVLCFLSVIVYFRQYYYHQEFRRPDSDISSANATLGFGGLFVVSGADSPRRTNIIQAANVTQIELIIPEQRRWTEEDKAELKEKARVDNGIGSLLAWLAHIHVLKRCANNLPPVRTCITRVTDNACVVSLIQVWRQPSFLRTM